MTLSQKKEMQMRPDDNDPGKIPQSPSPGLFPTKEDFEEAAKEAEQEEQAKEGDDG